MKIINGLKAVNFAKRSILDFWYGYEHASAKKSLFGNVDKLKPRTLQQNHSYKFFAVWSLGYLVNE